MIRKNKRSWFDSFKPQHQSHEQQAELEGKLWEAHQQASHCAAHVGESSAQLLANTARQQAILDGITELARHASSRDQELGEPMDRVLTALDRLRLVALNVGLEGARLGDPAGRALMNVADEVRNLSESASEARQDLENTFHDIQDAWIQVTRRTDELRESHAAIVALAGRQQADAQHIVQHVESFGEYARTLSGSDPQTALLLSQIAEHARGLQQALKSLGRQARRESVRSALGPLIQPLLRSLIEITKGSKHQEPAE